MAATELEASVRLAGGRVTIDMAGDIDGGARSTLDEAYAQAAASAAEQVLLNFTAVSYINSTGIALIVGLLGKARADGRRVAACGLSEHYREIFEITRLSDFMSIYPDEATATSTKEGNT